MNIYTVLFVDDEPNILQSIKRLFFNYPDFNILTASNAEEGAAILGTQRVDVLVSDEKMPGVQGSQFVQYVRERFPEVVRCILTGYADTDSILKAVNRGEVYRYLVKPWNDGDLISTVRSAAEYGRLKRYSQELQEQLKKQNESLKTEVARRTEYLQKALNTAKSATDEIHEYLDGIVSILSHLIELIRPEIAEHSARVARLAERIAHTMELDRDEIRIIRTAAMLKEVGRLGTAGNLAEDDTVHAQAGAELLESISSLGKIAEIVRYHHARYDGTEKGSGPKGEELPLGARIIRVASSYVRALFIDNLSYEEALEQMVTGINRLYDPHIVQTLRRLESGNTVKIAEGIPIKIRELQAGMILKNDLLLENGALALPKNTPLTTGMVAHIPNYRLLDQEDTVYIKAAVGE